MTQATAEQSNSREKNKEAKRARMQQTLNNFFTDLNKNKQDMSQRNVATQVQGKRLRTGKRLVPSGLAARLRKEKAERASKRAEMADEEEGSKRTISFGAGDSNTKTARPMKSALRKGPILSTTLLLESGSG